MIKLTKRKGFNFFRSYYDIFNELDDKSRLQFIKALLDKQFLGIDPTNLKGSANLAYIGQMHSIDSQVKGYEDKTGIKLTPSDGGSQPPTEPPCLQVQGKEEEKEKEQVQDKVEKRANKFATPHFNEIKDYFFEKLQSSDQSNFEAEKFIDFYSSKGWMVGRNKMKDWKASVRNWIKGIKIQKNESGDKFSDEAVRARMERW